MASSESAKQAGYRSGELLADGSWAQCFIYLGSAKWNLPGEEVVSVTDLESFAHEHAVADMKESRRGESERFGYEADRDVVLEYDCGPDPRRHTHNDAVEETGGESETVLVKERRAVIRCGKDKEPIQIFCSLKEV